MRYVIFGAGAVGGTIGARLMQAGRHVVLVARGAHLEAMRRDGLLFRTAAGHERLAVATAASATEIAWRPDDAVLMTVKGQDTAAALAAIHAAAGPDVAIVCAQNGVANERLAQRLFRRTYATVVMLPAGHLEPGIVEAESAPTTGVLDTGCFPAGTDAFCDALSADLAQATFSARPDPGVMRLKYRKLVMNLANVVEALCVPSRAVRTLSELARAEGERVLRTAGIATATSDEYRARRAGYLEPQRAATGAGGGSSTWQSLARRTGRIEVDQLNGEIVEQGGRHGEATPVNALLQAEGTRAARERRAPASMDAEQLLLQLGRHA